MTSQDGGERSLAGIDLFSALDPSVQKRLAASCRWLRYRRGDCIIEQGSESREVLFVVEGAVSIVGPTSSGREVAFATLTCGSHFGELSAIDGEPRSASAVAQDDTLVAMMPSDCFLRLLRDDSSITLTLLRNLARMIRSGDVRITELSTLAASQRICAELLRRAIPDAAVPGLWVVRPLPPLREIASHVGTSRETVARTLSGLYACGTLRRKGRNLYILDRPALTGLASEGQQPRSPA